MIVARHALASALVATALAVVAGVFVFARPQYRPAVQPRTYEMAKREHLTVQQVRRIFAAHGFKLRNGNLTPSETKGTWMRPLEDPSGVEAIVFGPRSRVNWGVSSTRPPLSTVVGNVAVSYYGANDDVLRRAKAAVAELEKS